MSLQELEVNEIDPPTKSYYSYTSRELLVSFVAGTAAGIANIFVGHPFDTIKVRMQMINTSFSRCFKDMVSKEGVLSLYKGITSPLLSVPFIRTTTWLSMEYALIHLGGKFDSNLSPSNAFIAGCFSGVVATFINCPVELVKCRLQMEGVGEKRRSTGAINLALKILREEKLSGLFRGFTMTMLRDVPGLAVSYAGFQWMRRLMLEKNGESKLNSLVAGAFAGVASWTSIYPQDLIKTRIQTKKLRTGEICREIWNKDGVRGFYRGFGACLSRAPFAVACSYFVYDEVKQVMYEYI